MCWYFDDAPDDYGALRVARSAILRGDESETSAALDVCGQTRLGAQTAEEVWSLLQSGLRSEAVARIDIYLKPKWSSEAACRAAYAKAMKP